MKIEHIGDCKSAVLIVQDTYKADHCAFYYYPGIPGIVGMTFTVAIWRIKLKP